MIASKYIRQSHVLGLHTSQQRHKPYRYSTSISCSLSYNKTGESKASRHGRDSPVLQLLLGNCQSPRNSTDFAEAKSVDKNQGRNRHNNNFVRDRRYQQFSTYNAITQNPGSFSLPYFPENTLQNFCAILNKHLCIDFLKAILDENFMKTRNNSNLLLKKTGEDSKQTFLKNQN